MNNNKIMRFISKTKVVESVKDLCLKASWDLPCDVQKALESSLLIEESPRARSILKQCVDNANIARNEHLPICQDTGFAVYFVNMGSEVKLDSGTIIEAIEEGTRLGYKEGYLRNSIVNDPLFSRKNTGNNTPSVIHVEIEPGDKLSIELLPKGGGSENMSALAMLKPSDGPEGVLRFVTDTVDKAGGNPCPPVIVGIGIGGTADKALYISKKALLRPIGTINPDERYAKLEQKLLTSVNNTGVGAQGLGGRVTAIAVHIETFPCHIASMPVAITLNCHAARRASVEL